MLGPDPVGFRLRSDKYIYDHPGVANKDYSSGRRAQLSKLWSPLCAQLELLWRNRHGS